MRRLHLLPLRGPAGQTNAPVDVGRGVAPGEASGVVGVPRVGVGLTFDVQIDSQLQDRGCPPRLDRLHVPRQPLSVATDEPSAADDLAHHRPGRSDRDLVGRHQRIVLFGILFREAVLAWALAARQTEGKLLGEKGAPRDVVVDRLDGAGGGVDGDLEMLVSEHVLLGQRPLFALLPSFSLLAPAVCVVRRGGTPRSGPDPSEAHRGDVDHHLLSLGGPIRWGVFMSHRWEACCANRPSNRGELVKAGYVCQHGSGKAPRIDDQVAVIGGHLLPREEPGELPDRLLQTAVQTVIQFGVAARLGRFDVVDVAHQAPAR